jgi:D-aminopeptidase
MWFFAVAALMLALPSSASAQHDPERPRVRDIGVSPGILPTGPLNAITDVSGVTVGHVTLIEGDSVRTGLTAILPHGGNIYRDKVPAGFHAANGFGKFMGSTQVEELGEIETPIVLTNTLSVPQAAAGVVFLDARPDRE